MPTAILLISEQTLPNVLFLKQFGPFEHHVFLTTKRMEREGRSHWIEQGAGVDPDSVQYIDLDPEDATAGLGKLEQQDWPADTDYLINLTGGTKMMALAAYAFFAGKPRHRIVYLPLNAPHFLQLYPEPQKFPLLAKVSLEEYLQSYGILVQSTFSEWELWAAKAEEIMEAIQGRGNPDRVREIIAWTQSMNQNVLSQKDRSFYTGEWLEIWVAAQVQKYWNIPASDIRVSSTLNRADVHKGTSYEYDVLFVKNNYLYLCECKYYNKGQFSKSKINKELFKFASAYAQLGLFAKPFFAIANDISKAEKALQESCKLLRLPYPASQEILVDPVAFKSFIENV